MNDLVEFLRARLDERAAAAQAATPGPWTSEPVVYGRPEDGWGKPSDWEIHAGPEKVVSHQAYEGGGIDTEADAVHIALNDPATVLAEVEAKRRIIEEHSPEEVRRYVPMNDSIRIDLQCPVCVEAREIEDSIMAAYPCKTLRMLALPYADHPDYREEWKL